MKMNSNVHKILELIESIPKCKEIVIIAIDGRCASGKTTLSEMLRESLDCNVFHIDDFFLQPFQRTQERLGTAGENVDHERFLAQVLKPLRSGEIFKYQRFDCKTQEMKDSVSVSPKRINIVEGSYCLNKALREYYDKTVFMNVSSEEQMKRIIARDGREKALIYKEKWIPMEESYFKAYDLMNNCDVVL